VLSPCLEEHKVVCQGGYSDCPAIRLFCHQGLLNCNPRVRHHWSSNFSEIIHKLFRLLDHARTGRFTCHNAGLSSAGPNCTSIYSYKTLPPLLHRLQCLPRYLSMHAYYAAAAFTLAVSVSAVNPDVSPALQNILNQGHQAPLYTYPTSLTQGIVPKLIHSHNDYWRDVPFYSAISVGAVSVEADVWLYNGTLYIGHERGALTNARTFESLYINPILDILHRQNPTNSSFLTAPTHNGIFDTVGTQTLYLFVDVKTDGPSTWPYVVRALAPL